MNTTPKCTVPNCERGMRRKALGLCEPHAEDYRAERGEYCAAEGCERGHIKGGYCGSHYSQKNRGEELTPLGERRIIGKAEHGSPSKYRQGCRCAECREAVRVEAKRWRDEYASKHGKGYYDGRERNRKVYERTCDFCAHDFTTKTHIARYCSLECAKRHDAGWSTSKDIIRWTHPHKLWARAVPVTVLPSTWTYTSGICVVCGERFVSRYRDVTCSTECGLERDRDRRRDKDARRRSREHAAFREKVVSRYIYERDGYKCHLCGKRTKADAKVPHPQAPTLDHIIPLAQGGTHERSNIATACFICNSTKSHVGAGDQLLLFG